MSIKERILEIRKNIEKDRADFENTPQPCPVHAEDGKFVRRKGFYTRGFAIFGCPKGHEFKVG